MIYRFHLLVGLLLSAWGPVAWAQQPSVPITTSVPHLAYGLESRSAGFGQITTVSPLPYLAAGLDGNPALLTRPTRSIGGQVGTLLPSFIRQGAGMNASFWQAGAWGSFGDYGALGGSAQYFSFGELTLTDEFGNPIGVARPSEWNVSMRYALAPTDQISLGIGMKLFHSGLNRLFDPQGTLETEPILSTAADVGLWYHDERIRKGRGWHWQAGLLLADVGQKVSYLPTTPRSFIPTRMELGLLTGWRAGAFEVDLAYQASKLMVPSVRFDSLRGRWIGGGTSELGLLEGMFTSFSDSDLGLRGELQEIIHQWGLEQRIRRDGWLVAFRQGLFLEHATKGNRRYASLGLSAGYAGLRFDLSGAWRWRALYQSLAPPTSDRWHWTAGLAFVFEAA